MREALKHSMPHGRSMLQSQCQQFVRAGNVCPNMEAVQFLSSYVMGMLKSPAFRGPNDTIADRWTCILLCLENISVYQLSVYYFSRTIALHDIPDHCEIPDEKWHCHLP